MWLGTFGLEFYTIAVEKKREDKKNKKKTKNIHAIYRRALISLTSAEATETFSVSKMPAYVCRTIYSLNRREFLIEGKVHETRFRMTYGAAGNPPRKCGIGVEVWEP